MTNWARFRNDVATAVLIAALAVAGVSAAALGVSAAMDTQPASVNVNMGGGGISNLQPNVREDQGIRAPGISNLQPNVHADQR